MRLLFRFIRAASTLLASCALTAAHAADAQFPNRPIRLYVGYTAGGPSDVPFRALADAASKILGQPVIVENRPGAAGMLPATAVYASKPDGYTLAQFSGTVFRVPYQNKTDWNTATDFDYVIAVNAYAGSGLVVPADSPFKTIHDYLDYARTNPGALSYSTPGRLTALHLMMEEMAATAGVTLVNVPFKGDAEALPAVLGGHVMSAASTPAWKPFAENGKLRLLLSFDDDRNPRWPDVPTIVELKLAKPDRTPLGIALRKGTDPAIVKVLHDAFRQAMASPDFKSALAKFDMVPSYMGSADYTRYALEKSEREKKIVEAFASKP